MSIVVNKTRLPVTEWQTASGSVVSISDARKRYAKSLAVALEPIQNLHGYANAWIGGAGKNKLQPHNITQLKSLNTSGTWDGDVYTINGVSFAFVVGNDGYVNEIKTSGTASANANFFVSRMNADPYAGMVLNGAPSNGAGKWEFDFSLQVSPYTGWAYDTGSGATINSSASGMSIMFIRVISGKDASGLTFRPMIRLASEIDATFAPYENLCPISGHSSVTLNHAGANQSDNPTSITVSLGQTVYGGSVDLVSGVGTVTHGCYTITGSELWNTNSSNLNRYYTLAYLLRWIAKLPSDNWNSVPIQTSIGNFDDSYFSMQYKNGKMCIAADGRIGINADLYDLYGGTDVLKDVQIVYELATPITFQLSPNQLEMLERYNTIWADEGDISLTFARIHS